VNARTNEQTREKIAGKRFNAKTNEQTLDAVLISQLLTLGFKEVLVRLIGVRDIRSTRDDNALSIFFGFICFFALVLERNGDF
jgi:hypothetical protein